MITRRDSIKGVLLTGAAAAKYVDAFMLNVNWDEISARAKAA